MSEKPSKPAQEPRGGPRIVVIGVGGAGGNAVNNMINSSLAGVEFVAANTDAQALGMSLSDIRIQMGRQLTQGLGAGSRPDIGRAAAEEALPDLLDAIDDANMVFITAGMGGGTGTGSAPVLAKAARESGILTIGVVTKPFTFEGTRRMALAEAGIEELAQHVDTLIVIPNQNLFRVANEKTTFADAFKMADNVLHAGVRGITDLMVTPGLINLDFADVRTVMTEMGKAIMGSGEAEGENRALAAAEAAISNPLLDDVSMKGARGVLINITGGMDLTLFEIDQAANRIRDEVDADANIIFGSTFDESMSGRMRVSLFAAGIDAEDAPRQAVTGSKRPIVSLYSERLQAGAREIVGAAKNEGATSDAVEEFDSDEADDEQPRQRNVAPVFPFRARTRERKTADGGAGSGTGSGSGAQSITSRSAPAEDKAPESTVVEQPEETPTWPAASPAAESPRDDSERTRAEVGSRTEIAAVDGDLAEETETAGAVEMESAATPDGETAPDDDGQETAATAALVLENLAEVQPETAEASEASAEGRATSQSVTTDAGEGKPKKPGGFFSWISSGGGQAEDLFKKADRYYHGQGVRKNLELAFKSYLKAAEAGHAGAQNRVGWMYEKGEGVEVDHAKAVKWYRKSAERGCVNAMNDLGYMYRQGWGVPQDYQQALLWFEQAASKFDSYAEYNMGQMFENGWGVEKDMDEAVRWFRRSAARGHEWAAKRLEELGIKT